jgi:hypothetical protein
LARFSLRRQAKSDGFPVVSLLLISVSLSTHHRTTRMRRVGGKFRGNALRTSTLRHALVMQLRLTLRASAAALALVRAQAEREHFLALTEQDRNQRMIGYPAYRSLHG